jgi:hypothetical protein
MEGIKEDWLYKNDPHGVIPTGWVNPGQYEVICFPAPTGTDVLSLMVGLKYPSHNSPDHLYSTTRCYIHVLQDYLKSVDAMEIFAAQDAWEKKKIKEFALQNPNSPLYKTWMELANS